MKTADILTALAVAGGVFALASLLLRSGPPPGPASAAAARAGLVWDPVLQAWVPAGQGRGLGAFGDIFG